MRWDGGVSNLVMPSIEGDQGRSSHTTYHTFARGKKGWVKATQSG